ncbi:MAG: pilus assembly protein PilP [Desulfuromonadaceae bacterium]|nr:pilus assembly protein PilP [Desulfuromonadaceae bacterium]
MRRYVLFFLLLLPWMLSGCSEDKPQQLKPVQTRSSVPPSGSASDNQVVSEEEVKRPEEPVFVYAEDGRRDPFTSLLAIKDPVESEAEPLTPLQKFGLKEIRLIAIVIGKGEPRAMVMAPDKRAYTVTRGIKIGRNKGVVQEITPEEVIVEERFRDFVGTTRTEIKRMTLSQGEGE